MFWVKMMEQWRKEMDNFITQFLQEKKLNGKVPFSEDQLKLCQEEDFLLRKVLERVDFTEIQKDLRLGKKEYLAGQMS